MIELPDLVGFLALEYIDQVVHAEALTGAGHGTQRHAAGFGGIPGLGGLQTAVAVAAGLGVGLSKIVEQRLAPAAGDLAQAQHGV